MEWGRGSNFILWHVDIPLFQHYLLKRPFFPPVNGFGTLVENHLSYCMGLFLESPLHSIGLIAILIPVLQCSDSWNFVISFEIRKYMSFSFVLFKMALAIRINLSISAKRGKWDFLIRILVNPQIRSGLYHSLNYSKSSNL